METKKFNLREIDDEQLFTSTVVAIKEAKKHWPLFRWS